MEKKMLSPNEFIAEVLKTESNDFKMISERVSSVRNIRLLHATMGLSTEITELFEALAKKKLDRVNLIEEVGDQLWYIGIIIDELRLDRTELFESAQHTFLTKESNKSRLTKMIQNLVLKQRLVTQIATMSIQAGTMLDIMKKTIFYDQKKFDQVKLEKNLSDLIITLLEFLYLIDGPSINNVFTIIIEKLRVKRYKSGKFSSEEAINRNLEEERKTLNKFESK